MKFAAARRKEEQSKSIHVGRVKRALSSIQSKPSNVAFAERIEIR